MGLLKAFGAAATAAGQGLTQMGALKYKEEQQEEQRDWEWKKLLWADDKAVKAATSASRIKAYETIIDQVGKEIKSIDETLGGAPNINFAGYDKEYLNTRREALGDLLIRADALLMEKSGVSQGEIANFFSGVEKLAKTKPGDEPPITEDEKKSLEENAGEGFNLGAFWDKWKPKGVFGQDAQQRGRDLAGAIKNIAWESDVLLNAIKKYGPEVGKQFIPNEDSEIRKVIASVLEGDKSIANAKSEEDIKNIIKDKGLLNSIVNKIMSAFESDAKEEWEGTRFEGMTPGEIEEIQNQEAEQVGMIEGQTDRGLLATADAGDPTGGMVDADMEEGYGRKFASTELPPGAMDSTVSMDDTALPPGDMTTTPRGETLETPPGTGEPHDVNYVEGRKAGTTNITSMTVGDIADQYGYNTRVGMMALTYDEIIDLMGKHFYKNMPEKEVRERVDSLPFGDNIQKQLLLLSLGED